MASCKRSQLNILALTKRRYTNKDLIDDRYGRVRELLCELGHLGYRIRGLCLSYTRKPDGLFRDNNVEWYSLNLTYFKIPGIIKFLYKANKMASQSDLIFATSDSIYAIIGYIIGRMRNIPVIIDLYDNYEYFLLGRLPLIRQLFRLTIRKCDAVICASKPLAKHIKSITNRSNVTVIENATNLELFRPMNKYFCRKRLGIPEKGVYIGTAGAIHPNRGITILFDAFKKLKETLPDLKLLIAGKWDRSIAKPKDKNIIYLGELPLEQIPILFNSLEVAVVCNMDNEFGRYCFPQKANEILACGIPIAAAKVGSMADLLKETPHCLFLPENVNSLMDCITNHLNSNQDVRFSAKSWKETVKPMDLLFKNVLLRRRI